MRALGLNDIRQLEDKIILCLQHELLKARLNQKDRTLHVQSTFGRDVQDSSIDEVLAKLQAWDTRLAAAQTSMEAHMAACTNNVQNNYKKQVKSEADYIKGLNRAAIQIKKAEEARLDADERGFI